MPVVKTYLLLKPDFRKQWGARISFRRKILDDGRAQMKYSIPAI